MQTPTIAGHQRQHRRPQRRRSGLSSVELLDRLAGERQQFQRALNPLTVGRTDAGCRHRVALRQLSMHRRYPTLRELRVDVGSQRRIGLGQFRQSHQQRPQIQHGAAHQQRHPAAAGDVVDQAQRIADKLPRRVTPSRVDDVDQVVRHRRTLGDAWFCGADVHATVDQRRVDTDDLHRKLLRQRQRQRRLAARRRAQDHPHHWRGHWPRKNKASNSANGRLRQVGRPWLQ